MTKREIPAALLQQIHGALSEKKRRSSVVGLTVPVSDDIIARGWIYSSELEDLLLETDSRVARLSLDQMTDYLELPWRVVFKRPRYLSAGAIAFNALTLADAACLLVRMEEMGFDSRPERLVQHGLRTQADLTHCWRQWNLDSAWSKVRSFRA